MVSETFMQSLCCVRFEVLTAVVMNIAILWYMAPCSPYVKFRLNVYFHLQGRKLAEQETSMTRLHSYYVVLEVTDCVQDLYLWTAECFRCPCLRDVVKCSAACGHIS
jgi:hypothetical protein